MKKTLSVNPKKAQNLSHLLALAALLPALNSHASLLTFTDESEWLATLDTVLSDKQISTLSFNGPKSEFAGNSSNNLLGQLPEGDINLNLIGGAKDSGPSGMTGSGFLESEVDAGSDPLTLRFNFPEVYGIALLGLQNDSVSKPESLSLEEIGVDIAGQQWLISDVLGLSSPNDPGTVGNHIADAPIPFLGWVSTSPFSSFDIMPGEDIRDVSGATEEFYLSGLSFGYSDSSSVSVPEPGSLYLLSGGLLGLVWSRRRIKRLAPATRPRLLCHPPNT